MPNAVLGVYSAYKFRFKDVPADYSEVYVYAKEKELEEIKRRFSKDLDLKSKNPNLFILKREESELNYGETSTIGQIFVDLWNLKTWYASEFLKQLEERLSLK